MSAKSLIWPMLKRDITARYRGSTFGIAWAFLTPLLLLSVYSFVFTFVFKARWSGMEQEEGTMFSFALRLFSGLLLHTFLSECFIRAPSLMREHANLVKRVVFPLETLPVVLLGSACFHLFIGYSILIGGLWISGATLPLFSLMLPLALLPFLIMTLGISWMLAACGVYLRDISQLLGLLMTILLFLSPIFYPAEALPAFLQPWLFLNPLTVPIETSRALLFATPMPQSSYLLTYTVISLVICWLGFKTFNRLRGGFAELL